MMEQQKVYIEYQFKNGPYGGANQFLKNLKDFLVEKGSYSETPTEADIILVNHTNISKETLKIKQAYPEKIFIHRMDGPVSKHRPRTKLIDLHSFLFDKMFCNGSVFQSTWTKENCFSLGYKQTGVYAVIHNAPNPKLFQKVDFKNSVNERNTSGKKKIKLVTTSWSPNWNKGFDIMQFLDENLDFTKYEYTFIGKSPIIFKNIKMIEPLGSEELATELQKYDIFIATSKNESCSNSLIEAINCGLAVAARESGCYREVIGEGGEIFQITEESIKAIDLVADNLEEYQEKLPFFDIVNIGQQYYDFFVETKEAVDYKKISMKKCSAWKLLVWNLSVMGMKIYTRCNDYYENHIMRKGYVLK